MPGVVGRVIGDLRWSTTLDALDVRVVDTARGPVELARTGTGPAVLLIHGIPGSWRQAVPLAEDFPAFDAILPSRPGYGRTPIRTGRTYDEQADAYAAVLDALGIEQCSIIGLSGGGPSALAFATRYGERTRSLVLACAIAAHMIDPPAGPYRLLRVPGLAEVLSPVVRALGRRKLRRPGAVDAELDANLTPDELARTKEDPRIRSDLVRHVLSHQEAPAALAGVRNDYAQLQNANTPASTDVRCPTLVLHGDADTVIPVSHGRFYADAIAGARINVYEQAGHVFGFTRRREVTDVIGKFLTETS